MPVDAGPKTVTNFPHAVEEIENLEIPLPDGCRLAGRVWKPADGKPVPAILEYLPYRKRDGTAPRDALTHPYLAGHGYACVRVDMRGNGESEGLMWDEYLLQEHDDALEVIAWLAAQPWCDGNVGMMGISWGGFNALQVAARRPPALKAIITLCSTDDRYADDIHYKGGCLLNENLGWAATMFAYSSRPPDPLLVGERWREMWLERLENLPLLVENWLQHPHRDAYWRHGSVCEDFDAIEAAVLAVGGWGDAYSNAVPRLLSNLKSPARGFTGPWVHKYPHFAVPGPAIGFLHEALRWWDHWLKGIDTGVMSDPLYRAYLLESAPPQSSYTHRDGRWIAERAWPSPDIESQAFALNPGKLDTRAQDEQALVLCSPQTTGQACGEYCAMWLGPEGPPDQRVDDANSLVFDSVPLDEHLEIFGAPVVTLELSCDKPQAFVVVRLCDVSPVGESARVTYGVLNLTHRESHAHPMELEPGRRYRVRVQLDDIAYAFPPGHKLRVAVSSAYWPLIWPSREATTLNVFTGASTLELPVRARHGEPQIGFPPPESAPPMAADTLRPKSSHRSVERDVATGVVTTRIVDNFGEHRITAHGLTTSEVSRETYTIAPDDPLSARAEIHWSELLYRGDWCVRTETRSRMWCDREHFYIHAELDAFEGEVKVMSRTWDRRVERNLI